MRLDSSNRLFKQTARPLSAASLFVVETASWIVGKRAKDPSNGASAFVTVCPRLQGSLLVEDSVTSLSSLGAVLIFRIYKHYFCRVGEKEEGLGPEVIPLDCFLVVLAKDSP